MHFPNGRLATLLIAALGISGCMDLGPLTGKIQVNVLMSGVDPDADGFLLNGRPLQSTTNSSITLDGLAPGARELRLDGVAGNCLVNHNPQTVNVVANKTVGARFTVTCRAAANARVLIETTGEDFPEQGFFLSVNGGTGLSVGHTSSLNFLVAGGGNSFTLDGATPNCTTAGGITRIVDISPGTTAEIRFESRCIPTLGNLRTAIVTSGTDLDADGYRILLEDGNASVLASLPTNGTAVTRRIAPGDYVVTLEGIALNCEVGGANPRRITVIRPDTAAVAYAIACGPAPQLAFDDGRWGDLWVVKANGEAPNRLLHQPAAAREPEWSPDGRKVVFTSVRDGKPDIYVANADGTGVTRLTDRGATAHSPTWSPDGRRIAFVVGQSMEANDRTAELFVMDADGSNVTRLTGNTSFDGDPAWSPDSRQIAFTSDRAGNADIYITNADGSQPERITTHIGPDYNPAWSPDGSKLAFARIDCYGTIPCFSHSKVLVANADGSGLIELETGDAPAWSPDGRFIAYSATACAIEDDYFREYACNSDGVRIRGVNGLKLDRIAHGSNPSWRR